MYNGKRYYAYGKTKEEAHDNAVKKQFALEHKVNLTAPKIVSVTSWAREWLVAYKKGTIADAWYRTLEGIVENYIVPELGYRKLTDIMPKDIMKFWNAHTDMSASYGNTLVQVTRQIFATAEENGYIDRSPASKVRPPIFAEKVGHRTITDAERELTIRTADKHPEVGVFYLVMLFCGLRPQEVCALRRCDIDLERKEMTIAQAKKSDDTIGRTKSRAGLRLVPIPDALLSRLDIDGLKPSDYVFRPPRADRHTKTTLRNQWDKFKRLMDIENGAKTFRRHVVESTLADDLTPYCYRHTYCTDLQDAGVPVTVAQKLMGHSTIRVTADIYTHHSKASFDDARERINALYQS